MRESTVESYFDKQVKASGGTTRKLKWINRRAAPDRFTVIFQTVWLVEVKRPGEKPTAAQLREHNRLRADGVNVAVVDSHQSVDGWISLARTWAHPKPARNYNPYSPQAAAVRAGAFIDKTV